MPPPAPSDLIVLPETRSPLEALAAELGQDAARLERELRLEVRAALAEHELRVRALEQQIIEQRAMLAATPGPIGPPGPPGEMPTLEAPDEVAPMIAKAVAMLAEAPPLVMAQPAPVVNVTVPLPAPRTERTRVTKHDEHGRIVEIERDVA